MLLCTFQSVIQTNSILFFSIVDVLLITLEFLCIKTNEFFDPGTDPLTKIRLFSGSDLIISRLYYYHIIFNHPCISRRVSPPD